MKSKPSTQAMPQGLLDANYPDFLALNNWTTSAQHLATSFPTFTSLVESEGLAPAQAKPMEMGLFSALIGDPRVLYYELLEDPRRFEPEAESLVQQLVSGARTTESLSPAEMEVLNRATIDMTGPRHKEEPQVLPVELVPASANPLLDEEDKELEYMDDGKLVTLDESTPLPEEAPATFWWRQ